MKIAIFSDNFYPEISGISDSVILLGRELAKLGHEVHFFGAQYSRKDYAKANLVFEEPNWGPNIKFHRFWSLPMLGSPTGQSRIVIPIGLRLWKYAREKFDIIYTQSPYGMGFEALLMSRFFKIPLIGTNHTPITEFTRYLPLSNKMFDWLGLNFVSWYYNRCQFVTAPYEGILKEMKQYGFNKPSMTLSNPVDLANFVPASAERKQELKRQFALSEHVVLYAGRLAPEKQVDVIIKALATVKKTIPDVMLVITGIGNTQEGLKKLAKNLDLEKNVKFLGRVDDQTHSQTYQASEMFAVMSTAETQCLSMMKAMSAGIPVLAADAWALPEYAGRDEKKGFVIPVGDEKTLAEKIVLLLQDKNKAQEMGREGIAFASEFSAHSVAHKWQEIFAKYAKQKSEKITKLSFVIPAYNEEAYVGKCLESVFAEIDSHNYNCEVIVVDNASKDKTPEVIKSFPRAKYVYEANKGLVRARSAGYKASTGEIVANVDSDSTLPSGWLKTVFEAFENDTNLVALSGPYVYPESSKLTNMLVRLYYRIGYAGHLFNQYVLRSGAVLQGGNFVVRRTAMEKIGGFDTTIEFYGEDTDVARRIQKVGTVVFTFKLTMNTSSRRFEGDGFLMTGLRYSMNFLWETIFKKPFTRNYNDFRKAQKMVNTFDEK